MDDEETLMTICIHPYREKHWDTCDMDKGLLWKAMDLCIVEVGNMMCLKGRGEPQCQTVARTKENGWVETHMGT